MSRGSSQYPNVSMSSKKTHVYLVLGDDPLSISQRINSTTQSFTSQPLRTAEEVRTLIGDIQDKILYLVNIQRFATHRSMSEFMTRCLPSQSNMNPGVSLDALPSNFTS